MLPLFAYNAYNCVMNTMMLKTENFVEIPEHYMKMSDGKLVYAEFYQEQHLINLQDKYTIYNYKNPDSSNGMWNHQTLIKPPGYKDLKIYLKDDGSMGIKSFDDIYEKGDIRCIWNYRCILIKN